MSRTRSILAGLGVALLAIVGIGLAGLRLGTTGAHATIFGPAALLPSGRAGDGLGLGQPAPELRSPDGQTNLLTGLDGRPILLADYRGRYVWIVFWATWCIPCQQEAPAIRAAALGHADDLTVVAIDEREPAAAAREFARVHDLDYPIGLDSTGAVMALFRASALPSHFFLDRTGLLVSRYAGQLTAEQMDAQLRGLTGS
jgi:thiol-disulfide isomerase/thioredoxin